MLSEIFATDNKYHVRLPEVKIGCVYTRENLKREFAECSGDDGKHAVFKLAFSKWMEINYTSVGGNLYQILGVQMGYDYQIKLPIYDMRTSVECFYSIPFERIDVEIIPIGECVRSLAQRTNRKESDLKRLMWKKDRIEILNPDTIAAFGKGEEIVKEFGNKIAKTSDNMYFYKPNKKEGLRW